MSLHTSRGALCNLEKKPTCIKRFCHTRIAYFSSLIEEKKNNPRFLLSTVAKLSKTHSSFPPALASSDLMGFFMKQK